MKMPRYLLLGLSCLGSACAPIAPAPAPELDTAMRLEWTSELATSYLQDGETAPPLWQRLEDPALAELISAALAASPDLAILQSRVREARFARQADVAALGPGASIGGSAGVQRLSENGTIPFGRIEGLDTESSLFEASFDASWEIDLFGRGKALRALGDARIDSAEQELEDARLTLLADLTRDYLDLRSLQAEAQLLEEIIASRSRLLEYVLARRAAGTVPDIDVVQQEVILAELAARRPALTADIKTRLVSLAILTGRPPAALEGELPGEHPPPPVTLLSGLSFSSERLRLRPDVRRAEQAYVVAARSEDLATLDFYPRITLLASAGPETTDLATFFDPASLAANAYALLSWALFDDGRRTALRDAAGEARLQAEWSYRRAVLRAMGEVESSAANLNAALQLYADRSASASYYASLARMASARYQGGTATRSDVDEALANQLDSRIAELRASRQAMAAAIAFEKAVGSALGRSHQALPVSDGEGVTAGPLASSERPMD